MICAIMQHETTSTKLQRSLPSKKPKSGSRLQKRDLPYYLNRKKWSFYARGRENRGCCLAKLRSSVV